MGKLRTVLSLLRAIPIVSTKQVARYFTDRSQPAKRAWELLSDMREEGIIETKGRDVRTGESNVWRLTTKGRDSLAVNFAPVLLTSRNIGHVLSIGDAFMWMRRTGHLRQFDYEPIETFFPDGKRRTYRPDAFFAFKGRALLLEMQTVRTPLSTRRWAEKWAIAADYFDPERRHFEQASWQQYRKSEDAPYIRPTIVVVSNQREETIRAGTRLPLVIVRDIRELEREIT